MSLRRPHKTRLLVYLAIFFLTLSVSLPSYINSTYLTNSFGAQYLSLIYGLGAILTISLTFFIPKLMGYFGLRLTTVSIAGLMICGLLTLVTNTFILPLLALGFITYYALSQVARYNTDFYLETLSDDSDTGSIRGTFMTVMNLAWVVSPYLTGFILADTERFTLLYFIATLLLVPFIIIFGKILPEPKTLGKQISLAQIFSRLKNLANKKDRAIRKILLTDLLLNFFYVLMVVYMPIHLHQIIGFSWTEIGFIFTIMLLPFVLFEYPLGQIADKWLGEKELLALGFTIAGLATIAVSLVQAKNIWLWAGLLFATRVGAAMIEIMKETALFKRIDGHDAPILAISRNLVPTSFLLGPAFATVVLTFATHQTIFTLLGFIMLCGLYPSLTLKDTR